MISVINKRSIIIVFTFLMLQLTAFPQEATNEGMKFIHEKSWNDVVARAKADNKLIFLDCYTTWCGPCKAMSSQIFPKKEVGDFYNEHFINAKVQLDTTDADNDFVKSWYQDGHDIATKYNVNAYPTYLIFNSDGVIVHRFVGSMPPDVFIAAGKNVLDPDKQYYTQIRKYDHGDRSPELLLKLAKIAEDAYDMEGTQKYANEYLATQNNLYTKDNLGLLYTITHTTNDKGFEIALKEGDRADKILESPGKSASLVKGVIVNEEFENLRRQGDDVNFAAYDKMLAEKYPKYATVVSNYSKMYYYRINRNWNLFAQYADHVIKDDANIGANALNDYAWTAFENVTDKALLEKALAWSKLSLEKNKDAALMDTHANLLYKLGRKKEAIEEEGKALKAAGDDSENYKETLAKMQKGEPTWPSGNNE